MIAFTLARRELRGGVRGLRIVVACLALGIAAIAAVGSLREGIDRGLANDGRRILGGDLEVGGGNQPLPDALRDWLHAHGARTSDVTTMRSMAIAPSGERMLVELKAVDNAYPLVGTLTLDPPGQLTLDANNAVVDPLVEERLNLHPGDTMRIGRAELTIAAALAAEPDRVTGPAILGPRVMISQAALPATDLVQPGSLLTYDLRAVLPPGADTGAFIRDLRAAFPNTGWRLRDPAQSVPSIQQFVDQTGMFLTLVGLTALLVGGIGVATGVRAWLEARARTIATLRCLGATAATVFATVLLQVAALTAVALVIGLVAGALLPYALVAAFGDALPVPTAAGVYPRSLGLAALYGVLVAGSFALWPLARAAQLPGAALFRDATLPTRVRVGPLLAGTQAVLIVALVALTVLASPERRLALWFCGGAAGTLVLFRAGAWVLMAASRHAPRLPSAAARLGLSNLSRPGAPTPLLLVALGLGLSTLAAVALIQGNIRQQVLAQIPQAAPTFFFIDIQGDQLDRFRAILHAQPGVDGEQDVPSLRARIVAVAGVPAAEVRATPDTQWALRGDRGLTYSATVPAGSRLVAGDWWPADYDGPPLVSFDAGLARGWKVGIGDVIRVNVLGRDIDLRIANLRDITWRSLGINFAMVASPGLLARAPHGVIATVHTAPAAEAPLLRAVTDALPNVSGIRVADVLQGISDLVGRLAAALAATGSVTLAAGALVLVGAIASGQRRRVAEAVVLKTLGATRAQVRAAWLVEFGLVGVAAGVIACIVGTAASWGVVRFLMRTDWVFLPGVLASTVAGCVALMLLFGYAGTAGALRARAAPFLREG